MDFEKNNLYELEILKQVEKSAHLNNRMVASKLGCSVKLAHGLLKKMVQKGFFNVKKLNSRHWDYYLTTRGISEKARLTYEFLDFSMNFYREARKKSSQVCKDIAEGGSKNVLFIGAGDLAEICYLGVKEWDLELIKVYDDSVKKQFMGIEIKPYSEFNILSNHPSSFVTPLPQDKPNHQIPRFPDPQIIICIYDKSNPMTKNYLPKTLNDQLSTTNQKLQTKFHWIF